MIPARLPTRVLVVDDSTLQREFAVELCVEIGIDSVLQAADGLEAIELLRQDSEIEAIILDLEMPGMDGVQVLHELVRLQLDPAIVVASSRESVLLNVVESMGKSLGLRLLGVLQKPISLEQLAGSLGRYSAIMQRDERENAELHNGPELTEEDVQLALQRGEFISFFQPKVALYDGRLCGVEALIRWQHPTHGLLPPSAFIGLVEAGKYISPVTLHMLEMSLRYCKVWHEAGLALSFSINVSAHSLADSKLADAIIDRVAASGIAPGFVILEITESAIMTDLSITLGTLARLRLKGFGLSIDDYGTGFSCMLQLSRVPCTELKIDRAFVNGASNKQHLRIMLESALDIARKLNLKVVAEGMETREDWQLLRDLECGEAQGYFVAKPMPGEGLLPWWRANQARLQAL
jgi:EAL domain-containing protein (putative c-di-GMP-specific phosphodiesterase class I)/FixJ family two-component response regulator